MVFFLSISGYVSQPSLRFFSTSLYLRHRHWKLTSSTLYTYYSSTYIEWRAYPPAIQKHGRQNKLGKADPATSETGAGASVIRKPYDTY